MCCCSFFLPAPSNFDRGYRRKLIRLERRKTKENHSPAHMTHHAQQHDTHTTTHNTTPLTYIQLHLHVCVIGCFTVCECALNVQRADWCVGICALTCTHTVFLLIALTYLVLDSVLFDEYNEPFAGVCNFIKFKDICCFSYLFLPALPPPLL